MIKDLWLNGNKVMYVTLNKIPRGVNQGIVVNSFVVEIGFINGKPIQNEYDTEEQANKEYMIIVDTLNGTKGRTDL
jgi:hypothetical protein